MALLLILNIETDVATVARNSRDILTATDAELMLPRSKAGKGEATPHACGDLGIWGARIPGVCTGYFLGDSVTCFYAKLSP